MFVKRYSGRKGPSYKQSYVPHDQRELNPSPPPIRNRKQADYYLNQLRGMGILNDPPIYIVKIHMTDPTKFVIFNVNSSNQSIKDQNFTSSNCKVTDIYNTPLDMDSQIKKIIDQNGYRLQPIIAEDDLRVLNGTNSTANASYGDVDAFTGANVGVGAHNEWVIASTYSYFTAAYTGATGIRNFFLLYGPNTTSGNVDIVFVDNTKFYLECKYLTCIVVPV